MSSPYGSGHRPGPHPDRAHLDTGELADEIAGVAAPAVADHLVGCPDCTARLAALSAASSSVTQYLRTDPEPELPAAVAVRFADAIAAESARRPRMSTPAVAAPGNRPVPSSQREGWWARHTRLGGVLVTAAALVVVGGGASVVANWVGGGGSPTNQAAESGRVSGQDSAAPGTDLQARPTPLGAVAGAIALHRPTFVSEIVEIRSDASRTAGDLTAAQQACAISTLAGTDLEDATLRAMSGTFTLDGTRVLVVLAGHDGTSTAVAISGCSSGQPQVAARGELP